jgi:hypothetical protein
MNCKFSSPTKWRKLAIQVTAMNGNDLKSILKYHCPKPGKAAILSAEIAHLTIMAQTNTMLVNVIVTGF